MFLFLTQFVLNDSDTYKQVKNCRECQLRQQYKIPRDKLRVIEANGIYDHLQIDLIKLLITPTANQYVIVVVDIFSKISWTSAEKTKHASQVVNMLERIISAHGPFRVLQSDHGTEFVNSAVESLCERYDIGKVNNDVEFGCKFA